MSFLDLFSLLINNFVTQIKYLQFTPNSYVTNLVFQCSLNIQSSSIQGLGQSGPWRRNSDLIPHRRNKLSFFAEASKPALGPPSLASC
jgi:hypothetical protein